MPGVRRNEVTRLHTDQYTARVIQLHTVMLYTGVQDSISWITVNPSCSRPADLIDQEYWQTIVNDAKLKVYFNLQ